MDIFDFDISPTAAIRGSSPSDSDGDGDDVSIVEKMDTMGSCAFAKE